MLCSLTRSVYITLQRQPREANRARCSKCAPSVSAPPLQASLERLYAFTLDISDSRERRGNMCPPAGPAVVPALAATQCRQPRCAAAPRRSRSLCATASATEASSGSPLIRRSTLLAAAGVLAAGSLLPPSWLAAAAATAAQPAPEFPLLVSPELLKQNLGEVKLLDAAWHLGSPGGCSSVGRAGRPRCPSARRQVPGRTAAASGCHSGRDCRRTSV